ncbi:aurora-related kinase 3, putative [Plasmodium chabaudi chabaudi]|uniref:Aurora-related kinase 3, putative n=1 Tax=Plasmodium chabaudi chabaudi TaxID=31271 RepID=A0A4V0K932_PLACU|nr:aurora-related kinase 3, putative [Plasmodium chabaudi chabaudi]VTZ69321.1 aurora-related kinase 3, putative [Plasmodium chabaudi chabaudi]|eukprot:XP_743250.2 serine/threonine protein kinase, putative [Plasmodium chabaudi chabaudi]
MNGRNMHSYYLDKIQKNVNQIKRSNDMSLLNNMNEGRYHLNNKKNTNYVDINESNPNNAKNGFANEYTYNQNINYEQNENINSALNRGKYIMYNNGHIKEDINTNYDYNNYVNKYKNFPDKITSENNHYNYDTIRTETNNILKDLRNVQYPYNNPKVVHDQNKGLIINSPCYSKINDCNQIYLANINENNHMFKNCHNGHMRMNASVLCPNHLKNNSIKQGYNKNELRKNNNIEMVYDGYYNSNDRTYMRNNMHNKNLDYKIHGDFININDNKIAQYAPVYLPHDKKMNKEYNYALRAGEHLNQPVHTGFYGNNNMRNNVEHINNISKNISSSETNKNNYFMQEPSYIENDLRQHIVENNYNRSLINITNNNCSKSTNIKKQSIYIPNKEHTLLNNSEINSINIECLKKNNEDNNVPVSTNLYQPLDETAKCQNKLCSHSIYASIPNYNNSSNTNLNRFVESTQIDADKKENFIIENNLHSQNNLHHNIKHSFTNETMDNVLETNRFFLNAFQKEKEVENEKKILLQQNEEDNMSKISENENVSCNFLPTKIINYISLNNNSKTRIQNNKSTENDVPRNVVNCVLNKDIEISEKEHGNNLDENYAKRLEKKQGCSLSFLENTYSETSTIKNEKEKEIIKGNNNKENSKVLNEMQVGDFDQIKSSDYKSEENILECNIFNIMGNSVRKISKPENCNNEKDVENKKEVNKFEEKNKISDISSIDNNSDENFHYENHIHKGYKSHPIIDNNMDIEEKKKIEKELESYFIKEGFLSPKNSNLEYNDFMSEKSSMYINGELQSDTSIYSENTKSFNTEYTKRVNCEAPSSSVDIFEDNRIKEVFDGLITNRSSTHSFSAQTDINTIKIDGNKNLNNYLENEIDISNTDNTSKFSSNENMVYNKDGNSNIICSKNIEQEKIDSIEYFFSKNKNLLFIDILKLNNNRKKNGEKKYVSFEDKLKDKLELLMHRDSEKERNIIDKIIYCLDPSYINNTVNDKKRWKEKLKYMQEKFLESILCVSYPNSMWNENTFELYLKSLNFNSLLDDTFIKYEKDLNIDLFQKEEEIFSDAGNIGEGGFGVVTKMRFLSFPQYYAIKKISKDHIIKSQAAGQAYLEAKYHSVLSHVNVIKMYGCMQDDNYIYHVLEYCPKGSIYSISKNFKKRIIPEELAYKYFCNVVNGLYYLNQMGIFHRDIKMENVLVDHKDNAKLSDFGLSAMILGEKSHSSLCGTLVYFSPEIISGEGYDWRSDIWSLGILLYEMLVGDVPFDGTKTQIVQSIYSCNLNFPNFINPLAINLIKKALVVDVNKRIKLSEIASDPWMQEMWKLTFQKGLIESNNIINDDSYNFNFIHNIIKTECLIKKSLNASLNFHTDSCSNNKLESALSNEKIEALDSLILETQQKIAEYLDLDEFYNNEETLSSFENFSTIKSEYLQSYSNEQADHTEEIKSDERLEENIESSKLDSENDSNGTQKNIYDTSMEYTQQSSNKNSMNIENNIKTDENINIENYEQMKHQLEVASEYEATNSVENLSINEVDGICKNEFKDPQMNNADMKNILSEDEKRSSCEYKYIRMNGMDMSEMQFQEENSQCSDTNMSVMNSHLSNKNEIEKEIINENDEMNEGNKDGNTNTNVDFKMNGNSYESILCNILFKLRKLNKKKDNSNIMEEIDKLKLSPQNDDNEGYKSISNTIKARLDLSKKKMSDYLERQCSVMSEHKNESELLNKSKTFENDHALSNENENVSKVENIEKDEVHNNSSIDKEDQINSEVGKLYIPISVIKENNTEEFENENSSFKINLKMKDTSTDKITSQSDISESDDIEEFNRLIKRTKNMLNRKMINEKKTEDDLDNDTTNLDNNKKIIDDNLTKFIKEHETDTKLDEACVVPDLAKKYISDKKKRKDCFDNNKKDKMAFSKKVEKNLEKKHNGKYNKKNMIDYKKKYSHKENRIGSKLCISKKNVAIEEEACNDLFNLDKGSLYDEYIEKINKLYLNLKNKKLIYDNENDKNTENSHILTKNIKASLVNETDNDSNEFSKEETERMSLDNIDRQNINEVKVNKYDNNINKEESLILTSNNDSSKESDVLDKGIDNSNFNKKKVNFCKKSRILKKDKNINQNLYDNKLNNVENSRKLESNNKCLACDDKKESSFLKLKKDVINGNIKSLKTRLTPDFVDPKINTKKNNNSNSSAYRYSSEQINKKVSINSDNKKSMGTSDNNTLDYSISDYSSDRSFYKKNKIISKPNNSIEKKNIKLMKSVDKGVVNMKKLEQSEYDIINNNNNKYKMESSTENVTKFSKKKTNSLGILNLNNKVTFMAMENYSNVLNSSSCMNDNGIEGNINSADLKKIEMSDEIKVKTEENIIKQIIYDEKKKTSFGKNVKEDLIYKKKSINKKDDINKNKSKINDSKNGYSTLSKRDAPIQNYFNNKVDISKNEAIMNEENDNTSVKENVDSPCVKKDDVLKKNSNNSTSLINKGKEAHIKEMVKKTSKEALKRSRSFQLNLKKNSYDDIQNRNVIKTCSMESALKKAASNSIGEKIKRNKKNNDDILLSDKKKFSTTNEECAREEDNDCLSNNEVKKNGNSYQSNKNILFANNLKNSKIKEYLKSKIDQIKNKKEYNPSFSGIEKNKDNESNILNNVNTKKSSSNINRVNKNSYQNNKIDTYLKKGKRSASETFLNNSINNCNNKQNNELKIKRTTSTSELYKTEKKGVQQTNANNSKKNKIKYGFSRSTSEVVKSFNKTSPPNFSLLFDTDAISEKKNVHRANSINNPIPNNRNKDDGVSKKVKGTSSMIHNQYKEKNNEQMEKIRTRTYTNIYSHKKIDLSNVKSKIDTNIFKKPKSVLAQNSVEENKESNEFNTKKEEIDIPPKNNNKPEKAHSNILSYNKKLCSKQHSYNNTHINDRLKKHSSLNKNVGSTNNINLGLKGKQINQSEVDNSKNMNSGFSKQKDHTKKNITNLINTKYDEDLQKKFLDLNNKKSGEIDTKYDKLKDDKEMSKASASRINDITMNANYRNSKTCEGNKNEKSNYTDIIVNCSLIDSCKNKAHNDNETNEVMKSDKKNVLNFLKDNYNNCLYEVKRENESIDTNIVEQENVCDKNAKKKCITNFSFNNLNCFMASSEIEKEDNSYEDNQTNNDIERDVVIRRDISKNRNYSYNGLFDNDKNINMSDDPKKKYSQKSDSSTLRAYERYKNDVNRLIKGKMYIDVYTNKDKIDTTKDSNNKKISTNSAQVENEKYSKHTSSNTVFSPSKILLSCSSLKSFYTDEAIQKHENDTINNKSKESIINTMNDMKKENTIENSDENNNDLIESFKKGTLLLKFKNLKKSASNIVLNNPLVKSFSMHNQRNILPKICSTSRNGTTESIFSTNENKTEKNKLHIINIEEQKNGGVLNRENLTFKSSNSRKSDIKKNNSILIGNKEAISCNKSLSSLLYNTCSSKSQSDFSKCNEQVFNNGNIINCMLQNAQKQCIQGKTRSGSSVSSISLRNKVNLDKKKSFTNTAKIVDVIIKKTENRNNDKISNHVGIINTKVVIE